MTRESTPLTIAIDGPSGSGKSSVSKAVAGRLGIGYLDTGAMYRALTWWCLDRGIDLGDQPAVAAAAADLPPLSDELQEALRRIYDERVRPHVHDRW